MPGWRPKSLRRWLSRWLAVQTFVALNTLMYVTLAVLKVLPKGYAFSWFSGRNRRAQNRSIYPEPPSSDR